MLPWRLCQEKHTPSTEIPAPKAAVTCARGIWFDCREPPLLTCRLDCWWQAIPVFKAREVQKGIDFLGLTHLSVFHMRTVIGRPETPVYCTSARSRLVLNAGTSGSLRIGAPALVLLMLACTGRDSATIARTDWRTTRDSTGWQTIGTASTACRDCLALAPVLQLGGDSSSHLEGETHWAARDSSGNYWLRWVDGVSVYDSTGRFLRTIGRAGRGPLEFIAAGPIYVDANGDIHLYDPQNRRETVLDSTFALKNSLSYQSGWVYEAVPLKDQSGTVVNAVVQTPDHLGQPLHLVHGSETALSFGLRDAGAYGISPMSLLRRLAVDSRGTIYSGIYFEYRIEMWRPTGERIMGIVRPDAWTPPPDGQPRPIAEDAPPPGLLVAMQPAPEDRLWVVTWLPKADWKDHVEQVTLPNGNAAMRPQNGNASLYETTIELLDIRRLEIIAQGHFDERIEGFLGDSLVFGNHPTDAGLPQFIVWRLSIQEPLPNAGEQQ